MASVEVFVDRIIDHLEEVIREETSSLTTRAAILDLSAFNNRKSQGLYDLTRALSMLDPKELEASTRTKLESLRRTLDANEAALSVHLQAVQEIADVVSNAVREAESDGTHDPPKGRLGSR